jgi:pimeloyl-ACP methyl ester carboxylesterase
MRFSLDKISLTAGVVLIASAMAVLRGQDASGGRRGTVSDTSRHRPGRVSVNGVGISYLDWGGNGPALVFIPGTSNSAHVFDDFAPRFTDRFRVVGITRVGFGESDQPERDGYDLASRVAHINAVLDSIRVTRAILVGHSFAGDEITAFAVAHPERVLALVYLDGAIDHTVALKWERALGYLFAAAPQSKPADRASAEAYRAYGRRLRGFDLPIGEILATTLFDARGAVQGPRAPERAFANLIAATTPPEFAKVRAPVLALYSDQTAADIMPWIVADSVRLANANTILQSIRVELLIERGRFARAIPSAQVFAYPAHHYQFLTAPADTERRMRAFFASVGIR